VVTGRYDVEWRDADGKVLRHLRRDVTGPALSARERKEGQATIDAFLARSKLKASELRHGLPDRKAPIMGLAFDQLGRLWVHRSVPDGSPREADLYDATGKWVAIVQWPASVNPAGARLIGAFGDRVLDTVRDTTTDVRWVVRMTMK
jgi:hypothetical protein